MTGDPGKTQREGAAHVPGEASVGASLVRARQRAGMSLEQVSAATRIRPSIVAAMEDDDFAPCGGDFYARANLRCIAGMTGADPAPLLAQYAAQTGGTPPRDRRPLAPSQIKDVERRGPNWSAVMAVALALVVTYGLAQAFARSRSDEPRPALTLADSVRTPAADGGRGVGGAAKPQAPRRDAETRDSRGTGDAVSRAPSDRVTVELLVRGTGSWVSVTRPSGETMFRGLIDGGQRRSFTDRERVDLVVGNAGATRLIVNGQRLGTPGRDGEVVRLSFTRSDPAAG